MEAQEGSLESKFRCNAAPSVSKIFSLPVKFSESRLGTAKMSLDGSSKSTLLP
jgi:hypothetical protein